MDEMIDPAGPTSGTYRVLRGGNWYYIANGWRAAYRSDYNPTYSYNGLGFLCLVRDQVGWQ